MCANSSNYSFYFIFIMIYKEIYEFINNQCLKINKVYVRDRECFIKLNWEWSFSYNSMLERLPLKQSEQFKLIKTLAINFKTNC